MYTQEKVIAARLDPGFDTNASSEARALESVARDEFLSKLFKPDTPLGVAEVQTKKYKDQHDNVLKTL